MKNKFDLALKQFVDDGFLFKNVVSLGASLDGFGWAIVDTGIFDSQSANFGEVSISYGYSISKSQTISPVAADYNVRYGEVSWLKAA